MLFKSNGETQWKLIALGVPLLNGPGGRWPFSFGNNENRSFSQGQPMGATVNRYKNSYPYAGKTRNCETKRYIINMTIFYEMYVFPDAKLKFLM